MPRDLTAFQACGRRVDYGRSHLLIVEEDDNEKKCDIFMTNESIDVSVATSLIFGGKFQMESIKSGLTTCKGISCLGLVDSLPGLALVGVSHLAFQVRQSALHYPVSAFALPVALRTSLMIVCPCGYSGRKCCSNYSSPAWILRFLRIPQMISMYGARHVLDRES
jgi:hypothetical protein